MWYEPIYNTTKAALMMFAKVLSTELVADNIRVNCVNPGLILTPDWIKTARQLTADKGGDWQAYLDGVAREHATIKRFAVLATPFSEAAGEVTPSLKLRRRVIEARYREVLDALYAEPEPRADLGRSSCTASRRA